MARAPDYKVAARQVYRFAEELESRGVPATPRQRAALTSTIHRLSRYAQQLSARHRRVRTDGAVP